MKTQYTVSRIKSCYTDLRINYLNATALPRRSVPAQGRAPKSFATGSPRIQRLALVRRGSRLRQRPPSLSPACGRPMKAARATRRMSSIPAGRLPSGAVCSCPMAFPIIARSSAGSISMRWRPSRCRSGRPVSLRQAFRQAGRKTDLKGKETLSRFIPVFGRHARLAESRHASI